MDIGEIAFIKPVCFLDPKTGAVVPDGEGVPVWWRPQGGTSQEVFLSSPVFETLYEGTRGPGKTDCLIMDFAQHVGVGWGAEWKGILFRETYPQLSDVITKTRKWFKLMFPEAQYNKVEHTWTWPTGEQLLLRHIKKPDDYWNYHGHAYPWIGFEELCNWPDDKVFKLMMSCCRSTVPEDARDRLGRPMPRKYRATTNPYGVGHNWVKSRYQLPHMRGRIIREPGQQPRVAIHGWLQENRLLLDADPGYIERIRGAARNPSELAAWIDGSWDITAGGMFDDIWVSPKHVVPSVPMDAIPRDWRIDRSFDWGSSKPFSVGFWAVSNGEPLILPDKRVIGNVRGDIIRVNEWYGWNGTRNEGSKMLATEVAQGIKDRISDWGIGGRVKPGPADNSIFDEENGTNIGRDMAKKGIKWERSDKSAGSRKRGWEMVRKFMKGALPPIEGTPRETPGLFIMDRCVQWLETVPTLPRDDKDLDDVNTDAEDHAGDETRYRLTWKAPRQIGGGF